MFLFIEDKLVWVNFNMIVSFIVFEINHKDHFMIHDIKILL